MEKIILDSAFTNNIYVNIGMFSKLALQYLLNDSTDLQIFYIEPYLDNSNKEFLSTKSVFPHAPFVRYVNYSNRVIIAKNEIPLLSDNESIINYRQQLNNGTDGVFSDSIFTKYDYDPSIRYSLYINLKDAKLLAEFKRDASSMSVYEFENLLIPHGNNLKSIVNSYVSLNGYLEYYNEIFNDIIALSNNENSNNIFRLPIQAQIELYEKYSKYGYNLSFYKDSLFYKDLSKMQLHIVDSSIISTQKIAEKIASFIPDDSNMSRSYKSLIDTVSNSIFAKYLIDNKKIDLIIKEIESKDDENYIYTYNINGYDTNVMIKVKTFKAMDRNAKTKWSIYIYYLDNILKSSTSNTSTYDLMTRFYLFINDVSSYFTKMISDGDIIVIGKDSNPLYSLKDTMVKSVSIEGNSISQDESEESYTIVETEKERNDLVNGKKLLARITRIGNGIKVPKEIMLFLKPYLSTIILDEMYNSDGTLSINAYNIEYTNKNIYSHIDSSFIKFDNIKWIKDMGILFDGKNKTTALFNYGSNNITSSIMFFINNIEISIENIIKSMLKKMLKEYVFSSYSKKYDNIIIKAQLPSQWYIDEMYYDNIKKLVVISYIDSEYKEFIDVNEEYFIVKDKNIITSDIYFYIKDGETYVSENMQLSKLYNQKTINMLSEVDKVVNSGLVDERFIQMFSTYLIDKFITYSPLAMENFHTGLLLTRLSERNDTNNIGSAILEILSFTLFQLPILISKYEDPDKFKKDLNIYFGDNDVVNLFYNSIGNIYEDYRNVEYQKYDDFLDFISERYNDNLIYRNTFSNISMKISGYYNIKFEDGSKKELQIDTTFNIDSSLYDIKNYFKNKLHEHYSLANEPTGISDINVRVAFSKDGVLTDISSVLISLSYLWISSSIDKINTSKGFSSISTSIFEVFWSIKYILDVFYFGVNENKESYDKLQEELKSALHPIDRFNLYNKYFNSIIKNNTSYTSYSGESIDISQYDLLTDILKKINTLNPEYINPMLESISNITNGALHISSLVSKTISDSSSIINNISSILKATLNIDISNNQLKYPAILQVK